MTDGFAIIQNLGLEQLLLWLLSFAIIYGVASTAGIPRSSAARTLFSIALSLLVLFAAPNTLISIISLLGTNLLVIMLGLLILIIFIEITGMKIGHIKYTPEGKPIGAEPGVFHKYEKLWLGAFIIIAVLVFIAIGGPAYIGIPNIFANINIVGLLFFIVIILLVMYMITTKEK